MPEVGQTFQLVRASDSPTTITLRVDFVDGGNDNVTVWLNPDFGLEEAAQASSRTTTFTADATFNEIRLREGGNGNGWTFSDIKIADNPTSIGFVPERGVALLGAFGLLGCLRRRR